MDTIIGVAAILLGLICWVGQSMAVLALPMAVKIGVFEPEDDVDQGMWLIERFSQGIMDMMLTWLLPAAGLLMILNNPLWPILALIGGGVYLYFPGVFIITRIVLKGRGLKVGSRSAERVAYVFGALWFVLAIVMIVRAIIELNI